MIGQAPGISRADRLSYSGRARRFWKAQIPAKPTNPTRVDRPQRVNAGTPAAIVTVAQHIPESCEIWKEYSS